MQHIGSTSLEMRRQQNTSKAPCSTFHVYDGTGEGVNQLNSHFRATIRSVHHYYKASQSHAAKGMIANQIYHYICDLGGHFFGVDRTIQSMEHAVSKIKRALKDMDANKNRGCCVNQPPTHSCQHQQLSFLPLIVACQQICNNSMLPQGKYMHAHPTQDDDTFDVYDGTGEQIKIQNRCFRKLIYLYHEQFQLAMTKTSKREILEHIYNHICSNGGHFFNVDGTEKLKGDCLQKIRKALNDRQKSTIRHFTLEKAQPCTLSLTPTMDSATVESQSVRMPSLSSPLIKTKASAVPSPVPVSLPQSSSLVTDDDTFDVYDGTGEQIKIQNRCFRKLIYLYHEQFQLAMTKTSKREILEHIYNHICSNGGHFFNVDGTEKLKGDCLQKIRKALNDRQKSTIRHFTLEKAQPCTLSLTPTMDSATVESQSVRMPSLSSPLIKTKASAVPSPVPVSLPQSSSLVTDDDTFDVYDGTGEQIKIQNRCFRKLIYLYHEQFQLAMTKTSKREILEHIYNHICSNGGHFFNVDGTEKLKGDCLLKIRKALNDRQKSTIRHFTLEKARPCTLSLTPTMNSATVESQSVRMPSLSSPLIKTKASAVPSSVPISLPQSSSLVTDDTEFRLNGKSSHKRLTQSSQQQYNPSPMLPINSVASKNHGDKKYTLPFLDDNKNTGNMDPSERFKTPAKPRFYGSLHRTTAIPFGYWVSSSTENLNALQSTFNGFSTSHIII
jgi:ribosomal protein L20A (L18A)